MKKVMIVDDAAFMRMSLRMTLEKNGYEVIGEAENGAVAFHKYMELKPDIVTMDITMPELDGVQATKMIKSADSDAKIVVVSALGQESYVRDAIMAGAKGFIVKPFKEETIIKTLSKL